MASIFGSITLLSYLKDILEGLPNNLPHYDEVQLLGGTLMTDDLCFLLQSPLFLYAISPRLKRAESRPSYEPATPNSVLDDNEEPDHRLDISKLCMRIKWINNSWIVQLRYGTSAILEGCQMNVIQDVGFIQSFFWFCEEANFLAYEYRARENASALPIKGSEEMKKAKSLKLKLRFRAHHT
ncbi:hypothetical protein GQ44DRAFT_739374 [Phaeosphaeriaceae sp. PMI808]|nr:hypothetical protein GQ44DRAFT_739374 [Phaeosphaeriaceae sp. PMI808]